MITAGEMKPFSELNHLTDIDLEVVVDIMKGFPDGDWRNFINTLVEIRKIQGERKALTTAVRAQK